MFSVMPIWIHASLLEKQLMCGARLYVMAATYPLMRRANWTCSQMKASRRRDSMSQEPRLASLWASLQNLHRTETHDVSAHDRHTGPICACITSYFVGCQLGGSQWLRASASDAARVKTWTEGHNMQIWPSPSSASNCLRDTEPRAGLGQKIPQGVFGFCFRPEGEELTSFSQKAKSIHVAAVADVSQHLSSAKTWLAFLFQSINSSSVSEDSGLRSHLQFGRQEGCPDAMHIASVDLNANIAIMSLQGVEGSLSGADVALAGERCHGDGPSLLKQRHVVAQGSVHVALRREQTYHGHLLCASHERGLTYSPLHGTKVGWSHSKWGKSSYTSEPVTLFHWITKHLSFTLWCFYYFVQCR